MEDTVDSTLGRVTIARRYGLVRPHGPVTNEKGQFVLFQARWPLWGKPCLTTHLTGLTFGRVSATRISTTTTTRNDTIRLGRAWRAHFRLTNLSEKQRSCPDQFSRRRTLDCLLYRLLGAYERASSGNVIKCLHARTKGGSVQHWVTAC